MTIRPALLYLSSSVHPYPNRTKSKLDIGMSSPDVSGMNGSGGARPAGGPLRRRRRRRALVRRPPYPLRR